MVMSGLADATKREKCGQPWSQGFDAVQNDARRERYCSVPSGVLQHTSRKRPATGTDAPRY
jgi:hypothetical protein